MNLSIGEGRTEVFLEGEKIGIGYLVKITGGEVHIGAVALGSFHKKSGRAYSSVMTLPGHKDDRIAKESAEIIARELRTDAVVVTGIHIDNITETEIKEIIKNSRKIVSRFINKTRSPPSHPRCL
ncbi:hypothetical protein AKJ65_07520 [candidate division MSBL1 archaeon SCGC-AAA259E19]|uniref:Prenylated flavin chaperone LpdD-like domain-containing protein n=2 Tax=candidate division MSBL1 TaxID=215777 RepID=A0A133UPG7_9EURY|nr:hypothetical protein AKJ65_07520 [candidate division MSBL1 archaeon SCGC-AAA259E19]KXA96046.1 hypothetical protein AKJ38_04035 [candidate division MSBL1 archaeon SCGC-AAA259I14]